MPVLHLYSRQNVSDKKAFQRVRGGTKDGIWKIATKRRSIGPFGSCLQLQFRTQLLVLFEKYQTILVDIKKQTIKS